ncbi:MAG: hypothetical protein PHQ20_01650, partial [Candidatus Moranbacteria bacterium]|nr:hypothetical protein [Candidatus Moranbacteria bacterium]
MKLLEEFILNNLKNYPEWAEYNDVILDFISSHKQKRPDMCVEGCKSLIEGISKFVYFNSGDDSKNLNNWKHLQLVDKNKKCLEVLKLDGYEGEFLRENLDLILKLGQVRNERGDVSHGQAYPKDSYSGEDFAKFIASWTEGLCYFLLSNFVAFKQKQKEDESSYTDEQFKEFDNYLDGLYPDIKHIK